jgi:hypothetical protein
MKTPKRRGKAKPMSNTEPEAQGQGSGAARSSSSANPEFPYRRFEEAYKKYVDSLHNARLEAQSRFAEGNRSFLQRLSEAQFELQKESHDSYRKYIEQVQNEDTADARGAAHQQHSEAANAAFAASSNRVAEINRDHGQNAEALRSDYLKINEDCYRAFLKDLQQAWSELDPDSVNTQHLSSIARLLLAATQIANSSLGPT